MEKSFKTMNRTKPISTSSNSKNGFTFTPTQILTNQILKVLKLRLKITNIQIPEEKLIELIKDNLSLIDIRYFKVTSLNIFVDDLINIIKKENQQTEGSEKDESVINQSTSTSARTTILSFNRKVYDDTNNVQFNENYPKKHKSQITPMRFNLENKAHLKQDEIDFYLDGNEKKEMTMLNDCDLEEIQENIIAEIAKEFDKSN